MNQQKARFEKTWGTLAKAVLDSAFYDLNPDGNDHHINAAKEKKSAIAWFESGRFRPWCEAAGFSRSDAEDAYLAMVKGDEK